MRQKLIGISIAMTLAVVFLMAFSFGTIATASVVDEYDGTSVSESLTGSGTAEDPYLIQSGADLAYFAANVAADELVSAYVRLTVDIKWSSFDGNAENLPASSNWTPMAKKATPFNGVFDGNGHIVSGMYSSGTSADQGFGFFQSCTGTIKDLTIKDSYFTGANDGAAFVGLVRGTLTLENCVNYAAVYSAGDGIGGFVGYSNQPTDDVTITNCTNYGAIIGQNGVGGVFGWIVGSGAKYNIENCTNYGTVTGAQYSGGAIGNASVSGATLTVTDCVNFGAVEATSETAVSYAGGIAGMLNCIVSADLCANYGNVTGKGPCVGGIAGQTGLNKEDANRAVTITNCINSGDVVGRRLVGGLVGRAYVTTKLEDSVSIGKVKMNDNTGGYDTQYGCIVGNNGQGGTFGDPSNCYAIAGSAENYSGTDASVSDGYLSSYLKEEAFFKSTTAISDMGFDGEMWAYNCLVPNALGYVTVKTGLVCYGKIELLEGASVRLVPGTSGIRFESELSMELFEWLCEYYGERVEIGTVICPTEYLASCTDFTMEAIDKAVADGKITLTGSKYIDIVRTKWRGADAERGVYTMGAALVNIKESNYTRALSARSYIKISIDDTTYYFYSDYSVENNSRTIADIATAALADAEANYTTAQRNILHTYNGTPLESEE